MITGTSGNLVEINSPGYFSSNPISADSVFSFGKSGEVIFYQVTPRKESLLVIALPLSSNSTTIKIQNFFFPAGNVCERGR